MRNSLFFPFVLLCFLVLASCQKNEEGRKLIKTDFESLAVPQQGYWNGSDGSGSFVSSELKFENQYTVAWQTWAGFSYSQMNDFVTSGYENQYSVIDPANQKNKFALFYPSFGEELFITLVGNGEFEPKSVDLCNSTYAGLSMKNGDTYSKKFGGKTGTDPDWFKVTITGYDRSGTRSGSVDIYLADFRSAETAKDYIIGKWTTFDLSALGKITKMSFTFSSSDTGAYGINTPTYACLDNLQYFNSEVIL